MLLCVSRQRYQSEAKIEPVDGLAMVKEMAEDMENMMADKIDAIKVRGAPGRAGGAFDAVRIDRQTGKLNAATRIRGCALPGPRATDPTAEMSG